MSNDATQQKKPLGTNVEFKPIGTNIEFKPLGTNVLIRAEALNSILGFINKEPDKNEMFTYFIEGYGNGVTDLTIGDRVALVAGHLHKITIPSNDKSFEKISKVLSKLTNAEREEFNKSLEIKGKVKFVEHFICERYAIQGIFI